MSPVALILGAGPNIGQAVARTFAAKGYKTALASWSSNPAESTDDQVNTKSDFCKTEDVVNAFEKAKQTFGIPRSVVYNDSYPQLNYAQYIAHNLKSAPWHSHRKKTPSLSRSRLSTKI